MTRDVGDDREGNEPDEPQNLENLAQMDAGGIELNRADWLILARLGRAMASAQLLDFTIFQLAHMERRTPKDIERAMRKIEGLLKQPKGDQVKSIADLDPDLIDDLGTAVEVRNRLAHDFFVRYRVEAAVSDLGAPLAASFLTAATCFMDDVRAGLDVLADARLEAQGLERPYLTDDEMDGLVQSMRRWIERGDEPADDS
ncbi:MAG: hypothetical protein QOJ29_1863 [Thermoleophilaceae bacterium]|nr:hypothetical protein [Thermoleophilaceae bacterium]